MKQLSRLKLNKLKSLNVKLTYKRLNFNILKKYGKQMQSANNKKKRGESKKNIKKGKLNKLKKNKKEKLENKDANLSKLPHLLLPMLPNAQNLQNH